MIAKVASLIIPEYMAPRRNLITLERNMPETERSYALTINLPYWTGSPVPVLFFCDKGRRLPERPPVVVGLDRLLASTCLGAGTIVRRDTH
jgi:hypothetical protein